MRYSIDNSVPPTRRDHANARLGVRCGPLRRVGKGDELNESNCQAPACHAMPCHAGGNAEAVQQLDTVLLLLVRMKTTLEVGGGGGPVAPPTWKCLNAWRRTGGG